MTDSLILFRKIKDVALRKPVQSERFKNFVTAFQSAGRPDLDFHHVFGSVHGLKSSGYLGVAVGRQEHSIGQDDPAWLLSKIPEAVGNLLKYAELLEIENETLRMHLAECQERRNDPHPF